MKKRFYLDTNIWMDYFGERKDNILPLGEIAFRFIQTCMEKNDGIIVSNLVLSELKRFYSPAKIELFMTGIKPCLEYVEFTLKDSEEAKQLVKLFSQSHFSDILHVIIARNNDAILVTRDKGFEELKTIIPLTKPEEYVFD